MSNRKYEKRGSNNISQYCNDLMNDFFKFCDGHPEYITTMVWIKDIEKPMPPSPKQMGTLLSRLDVIWKKYCDDAQLPRETKGLLISRVKEQWQERGKQQMSIQKRKRKRQ